MNDDLAERLLHTVLELDDEDLPNERSFLQAISSFKYDQYQQFAPGLQFLESLCLWLEQFTISERKIAYDFIKKNLIFISQSEIKHLIKMTYPDVLKPFLIKKVANLLKIDDFLIIKILKDPKFNESLKKSLFFGLSDGAHIDDFRRFSGISNIHEQMYLTYDVSNDKAKDFQEKLCEHLSLPKTCDAKYENIFLIDDFSGSGYSFIHKNKDKEFGGKLVRFYESLEKIINIFDIDNLEICVVLYLATNRAKNEIEPLGKEFFKSKNLKFNLLIVYELNDGIDTSIEKHPDLFPILKKYYTNKIETSSYVKGDMKNPFLGFNGCALPLILYHNCPNNSLPLLWMNPDYYKLKGLFPRIERFVKE